MTTHTITLARHTAQVVGLMGVLVLGTWDSYGTAQLLLRPGPCAGEQRYAQRQQQRQLEGVQLIVGESFHNKNRLTM